MTDYQTVSNGEWEKQKNGEEVIRKDERQAVIKEIEEYSYQLCAHCMHELRAKLVEMKEGK